MFRGRAGYLIPTRLGRESTGDVIVPRGGGASETRECGLVCGGIALELEPVPQLVTVVTVTFGKREGPLKAMVRECIAQGVGRVLIVDNGSPWDVSSIMNGLEPDRIEVIRLPANLGSAAGYAEGIKRALAAHAEYVWLLDDDNLPEQGCLPHLLSAYRSVAATLTNGRVAVAALRVAPATVSLEYPPVSERDGSFMHFHFLDIPKKMWRRSTKGRAPRDLGSLPELMYVNEYPYSGLLFHRSTLEIIGLPRREFVLYMDDIEFTRRLQQIDGRLAVAARARILDLESNASGDARLFGALRRWDRWRSYYLHRNKVWLDNHPRRYKGRPTIYCINMAVWLSVLFVVALATNRLAEFRVLITSIKDGIRGRMGLNDAFPLP
jgi:GT2 family glycosyltransferase